MSDYRLNERIGELEDKLEFHLRNSVITRRKVLKCGADEATFRVRFGGAGELEIFAPSGGVTAFLDDAPFDYVGGGFYSVSALKGEHAVKFSGTAAAIKIEISGKGAAFI